MTLLFIDAKETEKLSKRENSASSEGTPISPCLFKKNTHTVIWREGAYKILSNFGNFSFKKTRELKLWTNCITDLDLSAEDSLLASQDLATDPCTV